jgi:hypothetical protein
MALILPKGIVVNSDQIEGNIGSIDAEPLDEADIAKVWKGSFVTPLQTGLPT